MAITHCDTLLPLVIVPQHLQLHRALLSVRQKSMLPSRLAARSLPASGRFQLANRSKRMTFCVRRSLPQSSWPESHEIAACVPNETVLSCCSGDVHVTDSGCKYGTLVHNCGLQENGMAHHIN